MRRVWHTISKAKQTKNVKHVPHGEIHHVANNAGCLRKVVGLRIVRLFYTNLLPCRRLCTYVCGYCGLTPSLVGLILMLSALSKWGHKVKCHFLHKCAHPLYFRRYVLVLYLLCGFVMLCLVSPWLIVPTLICIMSVCVHLCRSKNIMVYELLRWLPVSRRRSTFESHSVANIIIVMGRITLHCLLSTQVLPIVTSIGYTWRQVVVLRIAAFYYQI